MKNGNWFWCVSKRNHHASHLHRQFAIILLIDCWVVRVYWLCPSVRNLTRIICIFCLENFIAKQTPEKIHAGNTDGNIVSKIQQYESTAEEHFVKYQLWITKWIIEYWILNMEEHWMYDAKWIWKSMFKSCLLFVELCANRFVSITCVADDVAFLQYVLYIETCPCNRIADQLEFKSVYKHKYHETANVQGKKTFNCK